MGHVSYYAQADIAYELETGNKLLVGFSVRTPDRTGNSQVAEIGRIARHPSKVSGSSLAVVAPLWVPVQV